MGLFRPKRVDYSAKEIERLERLLSQTNPNSPEYLVYLNNIDKLLDQKQTKRIAKRRIPTDLKKPLVGGAVLGALSFWNWWLGNHGEMLTGDEKSTHESLLTQSVRMFTGFKIW